MKFQIKKITKKSGLRVIYVPISTSNVVTTMLLFGAGSRDEAVETAGIAHVLEHMHYKGTKKRPTSFEIADFIESIGGEHNAFTGKEYTGYYTKVASKNLEKAFDFLSDLLINPLFDAEGLENEKKVILQELSMYQDMPMEVVASNFEELIFGQNALGRDIIGTKKSILNVSRNDLLEFKKRYYQPSNTILVIAGNFQQFESKLDKLVDHYFTFEKTGITKKATLGLVEPKLIGMKKKKTEQSHVCLGFRGVSATSNDRFALRLLSIILGDSMSSRMFIEIREKRNLAYAIRTSMSTYVEAGSIETQAGVAHDKVVEAISAILNEYKKIKKTGVTLSELRKSQEIISGKMLISFEDSENIANFFANSELFGTGDLSPEEILLKYNQVTTDEIKRVAEKYLDFDKLSVSVISPTDLTTKILKTIKEVK